MDEVTDKKRKTLLFVYNAHSGKGLIREHLLNIVDVMTKAGYDVTIYPTQERGDATRQVKERGGSYDLFVCSGGDGTLDEVVKGMIESDCHTPIGYIPAGSTNDFAVSLGISTNMEEAAADAVKGKTYLTDVGFLNGVNFVYVAAFGMFTKVSYETPQEMKNTFGHMAYIMEGAKQILDIPSYKATVRYDDVEFTDTFIYGMVTNSVSVGGIKGLTGNNVLLDDGLFEVMLIRTPGNPLELNEIIWFMADHSNKTSMVYCFKTDHLEIISEEQIAWTVDGEYGGTYTRAVIDNEKKRIPIIAGRSVQERAREKEAEKGPRVQVSSDAEKTRWVLKN